MSRTFIYVTVILVLTLSSSCSRHSPCKLSGYIYTQNPLGVIALYAVTNPGQKGYRWSTSTDTTSALMVNSLGIYCVTVTDPQGCEPLMLCDTLTKYNTNSYTFKGASFIPTDNQSSNGATGSYLAASFNTLNHVTFTFYGYTPSTNGTYTITGAQANSSSQIGMTYSIDSPQSVTYQLSQGTSVNAKVSLNVQSKLTIDVPNVMLVNTANPADSGYFSAHVVEY